jgi:stage III sporulation protein AF
MDIVYTWIKNVVIYMIINTIIMNLLGNSSYKKYVSIVSGMILVLIVVSPLMQFMNLDDKLDYFLASSDYSVEVADFKNDLRRMDEKQSDAIFAEYIAKIKTNVENLLLQEGVYLASFDLSIDRDVGSATFGEIRSMDIKASRKKTQNGEKEPMISIENIEITKIETDGQSRETVEKPPSPQEILIKNKLSDFYNIEQGNINISIQGGRNE